MHGDAARARMRVLVKRILRKYGYPPDLQDAAGQTVLQQAEALSAGWAGGGEGELPRHHPQIPLGTEHVRDRRFFKRLLRQILRGAPRAPKRCCRRKGSYARAVI